MKKLAGIAVLTAVLTGCSGGPSMPTAAEAGPTVAVTGSMPEETQTAAAQSGQEVAPAAGPSAEAEEPAVQLEGLEFDWFLEESYRTLLMRTPEQVVEAGLVEIYGLEEVSLNNVSEAYVRETYDLYRVVLDRLHDYDRTALTPEQQVSYDIYAWGLDDVLRGEEFLLYGYPGTFLITTSIHVQTEQFFTENHPVRDGDDVANYVTRLGLVDEKFDQLIERLRASEEAGIVPPRFAIQWTLGGVEELANSPATATPYYTALAQKVSLLGSLSESEKDAQLRAAEAAIEESVIPAYGALAEYLRHQLSVAPTADGVWQFEGGDAYYAYTLRHHTTTDLTADDIHQMGLRELDRIHAAMRAVFDEMGYPQDESLPELYGRVAADCGSVAGDEVLATYEQIIDEANSRLEEAFDLQPAADVVVIGDDYGGFYVPPAVDGSRPGVFFANVSGAPEPIYGMRSLAYHEAVPGHHLQIALQQEMSLPAFRRGSQFNAFVEGWALYAERLAWELGWYEDDPCGTLGSLQYEALRAARLVVDTGLHAQHWTFDEAVAFFAENTGYDEGFAQNQIARYVVWPGQATAYMVGMLELLDLRQRAKDALGDEFDLVEFHHVLLSTGSMPLEVLDRVLDRWIEEQQHR